MSSYYLLPYSYKKVGWLLFIPSLLVGLVVVFTEYQPDVFTIKVPVIYHQTIISNEESNWFKLVENNLLNELIGIILIVSGFMVGFSKVKEEDEFITKMRLDALAWSLYLNYGVLLLGMILVYDIDFYWVMLFNMFTSLLFFIVRFHWLVWRFRKEYDNEK